jgi:hypothetical protein
LNWPEKARVATNYFMDPIRWIMLIALSLFLAEGFALSVFPAQFRDLISQLEPKALQTLGLIETVLAAALIAGVLFG